MVHQLSYNLAPQNVADTDPNTLDAILGDLMMELEMTRSGSYPGGIEERIDRLELAVLALAAVVTNQTT